MLFSRHARTGTGSAASRIYLTALTSQETSDLAVTVTESLRERLTVLETEEEAGVLLFL